ncbi:hypothetical protein HYALB_00001528 [Hymenoscyphus albidus]|uniref:Uncharacterized protein n=1 Tax=Hymenoscyphus albidus TaxID=595503 RepID=A0A9N9L8V6_9HELO|nr:hypothetical protein HYALB_00001528 [Hymenoscyphus albidus]
MSKHHLVKNFTSSFSNKAIMAISLLVQVAKSYGAGAAAVAEVACVLIVVEPFLTIAAADGAGDVVKGRVLHLDCWRNVRTALLAGYDRSMLKIGREEVGREGERKKEDGVSPWPFGSTQWENAERNNAIAEDADILLVW